MPSGWCASHGVRNYAWNGTCSMQASAMDLFLYIREIWFRLYMQLGGGTLLLVLSSDNRVISAQLVSHRYSRVGKIQRRREVQRASNYRTAWSTANDGLFLIACVGSEPAERTLSVPGARLVAPCETWSSFPHLSQRQASHLNRSINARCILFAGFCHPAGPDWSFSSFSRRRAVSKNERKFLFWSQCAGLPNLSRARLERLLHWRLHSSLASYGLTVHLAPKFAAIFLMISCIFYPLKIFAAHRELLWPPGSPPKS